MPSSTKDQLMDQGFGCHPSSNSMPLYDSLSVAMEGG